MWQPAPAAPSALVYRDPRGRFALEVPGTFVQAPQADVPCEAAWLDAAAQAVITLHRAAAPDGLSAAEAVRRDVFGLSAAPSFEVRARGELPSAGGPVALLAATYVQPSPDGFSPPLAAHLRLAVASVGGELVALLARAEHGGLDELAARLGQGLLAIATPKAGFGPADVGPAIGFAPVAPAPSAAAVPASHAPPVPAAYAPPPPAAPAPKSVAQDDAGADELAVLSFPPVAASLSIPAAWQLLRTTADGATLDSHVEPGFLLVHAGRYPDPAAAVALVGPLLRQAGLAVEPTAPPAEEPAGVHRSVRLRLAARGENGAALAIHLRYLFGRTGNALAVAAVTSPGSLERGAVQADAAARTARLGACLPHPDARALAGTYSRYRGGSSGAGGAHGSASTSRMTSWRFSADGRYEYRHESSYSASSGYGTSGLDVSTMGGSSDHDQGTWLYAHGALVLTSARSGSRIVAARLEGRKLHLDGEVFEG